MTWKEDGESVRCAFASVFNKRWILRYFGREKKRWGVKMPPILLRYMYFWPGRILDLHNLPKFQVLFLAPLFKMVSMRVKYACCSFDSVNVMRLHLYLTKSSWPPDVEAPDGSRRLESGDGLDGWVYSARQQRRGDRPWSRLHLTVPCHWCGAWPPEWLRVDTGFCRGIHPVRQATNWRFMILQACLQRGQKWVRELLVFTPSLLRRWWRLTDTRKQ